MEILIGINVLIIVIAFFASGKFAGLAIAKGYPSDRAKKYPYFVAAGAFFLNILGQTILSFVSQAMMTLLFYCWSGFIVMVMIAILVKAYKNMKLAPDAKTVKSKKS
ncbi:MAG: hypothetical protein ACSHX6_11825 [Akkermansiaceae bacterium]